MKRLIPPAVIVVAVGLTTVAWLLATPEAGAALSDGWESPGVRLAEALLIVALVGTAVFSVSRHGWWAAAAVVVAATATSWLTVGAIDALAGVVAGAVAFWTAFANGGRGRERFDWTLSRVDQVLLVGGWLAMVLLRPAGVVFAFAIAALAVLLFDVGIAHLRRSITPFSWLMVVTSSVVAIIDGVRSDVSAPAVLIVAPVLPALAIGGRWAWRRVIGGPPTQEQHPRRERAVVGVVAILVGGLLSGWLATSVLHDESGMAWFVRSSLPLLVGIPIVLSAIRPEAAHAARLAQFFAGGALIAAAVGFIVAAGRWTDSGSEVAIGAAVFVLGAALLWWSVDRIASAADEAGHVDEASASAFAAGVNLLGYHGAASGLGVAARRIHASLVAAGVPVSIFDVDLTDSPRAVPTADVQPQPVRSTTLAVVTAPELPAALRANPELQGVDRVIGYWFWEVDTVPDSHAAAFGLVDEVWAPTAFVADAYRRRPDAPPVVHQSLHLAAPAHDAALTERWRSRLAPNGEFVFVVTLDLFSIVERKNPFAAIEAFERVAQQSQRPVRLIIKTLNGDRRRESLRRITDLVAASDARESIEVIDDFVSDADMTALVDAADCLVSLHRGEGLGLHLADAMWLGTPVIATRYSGNLDFMHDGNSLLVDADLVDVEHGEGAYPETAQWADADADQAARYMLDIANDVDRCARVSASARSSMALLPSSARHGLAYAETLVQPVGEGVAPVPDFNDVLHQLRTEALAGMPAGAARMLSVGCAGRWYFDWMEAAYGPIDEHVGIEFFSPEPDDLPAYVTWIADTASNMASIDDSSADLLFSGQNIEHLWPVDIVGFLAESNRVVRPGGTVVIDSPNRLVTERLGWSQPEHTIEFTAAEITELLEIAGFNVTKMTGLWDCGGHASLEPLSTAETHLRTAAIDGNRLDDAFVWWAEAERVGECDSARLGDRVEEIFAIAWPERLRRRVVDSRAVAVGTQLALPAGHGGVIVHGPHTPLSAGSYEVSFDVTAHGAEGEVVGACLVQAGAERLGVVEIVGTGSVEERSVRIPIELDEMTFGIHGRVDVTGIGSLSADPTISFRPERPVGH